MKTITNHQRNFVLRKVLFLRYGTEEPAPDAKPIVSVGIVANLLHIPFEKLKWIIRYYFA